MVNISTVSGTILYYKVLKGLYCTLQQMPILYTVQYEPYCMHCMYIVQCTVYTYTVCYIRYECTVVMREVLTACIPRLI